VLTPTDTSAVGGVQPLVEIINRADPTTEKSILEGLELRDKALADEVRSMMFVFADITLLEDRAIQLVLRGVEMSTLATALKGAADEVRDKVLSNLSERARENLVDEMDMLGPVRMSVVEEARASVVQAIRQLEETGQIVISREGEDEFVA
jgi:flagellar motor switch protein FliG